MCKERSFATERVVIISQFLQVLAFITMLTAAVARSNVDDIVLEGERYVDKSALRGVFGYSVAIAVFILIGFVAIIVIRLLGIGVFNQFWIVFGILVSISTCCLSVHVV